MFETPVVFLLLNKDSWSQEKKEEAIKLLEKSFPVSLGRTVRVEILCSISELLDTCRMTDVRPLAVLFEACGKSPYTYDQILHYLRLTRKNLQYTILLPSLEKSTLNFSMIVPLWDEGSFMLNDRITWTGVGATSVLHKMNHLFEETVSV